MIWISPCSLIGPSVARRGNESVAAGRAVDADGVVAARRPWSALPGAEPLDAVEPGVGRGGVVGGRPRTTGRAGSRRSGVRPGGRGEPCWRRRRPRSAGRRRSSRCPPSRRRRTGARRRPSPDRPRSTRSSGAFRRAWSSIAGSRSTPTTSMPRAASSIATRPVPQPASSTEAGSNRHTRSASPWIDLPSAARARHRAS